MLEHHALLVAAAADRHAMRWNIEAGYAGQVLGRKDEYVRAVRLVGKAEQAVEVVERETAGAGHGRPIHGRRPGKSADTHSLDEAVLQVHGQGLAQGRRVGPG